MDFQASSFKLEVARGEERRAGEERPISNRPAEETQIEFNLVLHVHVSNLNGPRFLSFASESLDRATFSV